MNKPTDRAFATVSDQVRKKVIEMAGRQDKTTSEVLDEAARRGLGLPPRSITYIDKSRQVIKGNTNIKIGVFGSLNNLRVRLMADDGFALSVFGAGIFVALVVMGLVVMFNNF